MYVEKLHGLLTRKKKTVAVAESCTGGLIAKELTDLPGSSVYFMEGMVVYSNASKIRQLAVPEMLLTREGAVSPAVARAMAENCRNLSGADFALSTTGIAGPGGGTHEKPVGLVYVAIACEQTCTVYTLQFDPRDSRTQIRQNTAKYALQKLCEHLLVDSDTD